MAAKQSAKPVDAPASRTMYSVHMHVPVGMIVSTVTALENWLMKTMTEPAARKRMEWMEPVEGTRFYIRGSLTFPSLLKCIHVTRIDINMFQTNARSGCMIA